MPGRPRRRPGSIPSPAGSIPRCIASACGPSGSTPASGARPRPTPASGTCWGRDKRAFPSPSICPPRSASMRLATDLFAYCRERLPNWNTISISGYHLREAGATAVQELGFTMAHAIAYVEAAQAAGLQVDDFAPRLSFFFAVFSDFFEEVAKFRAARAIWASLMRDRFGARNPRSQLIRFYSQTGGSTLTAQQ